MRVGRTAGHLVVFFAVTLMALSACNASATPRPTNTTTASGTPAVPAETTVPATAWPTITTACPVTMPNGNHPPGEAPHPSHYGNGKLWTALWPEGKFIVSYRGWIQPDGRIAIKWPWWRALDAAGPLTVTGRRLDAEAPPLEAIIPSGYGRAGFQVTGLIFSTPGCWEVTGHAAGYELTFVTEVIVPPELTGGGG